MNKIDSTYRIQFNPEFTFEHAMSIADYLSDMGYNTLYASPVFKAKKGSEHGYDVIDPLSINDELGGEERLISLSGKIHENGMTWLQDIVPNHMAYSSQNPAIMDIFEKGRKSPYYRFFDIDWDHTYEHIKGKVIAPFLGRFYAECLHQGELSLVFDEQGLSLRYYENRFPISLNTYSDVFLYRIDELRKMLEHEYELVKFIGVLHFLKSLNIYEDEDDIYWHKAHPAKNMLLEIYVKNAQIREFMDENLRIFNGTAGEPKSFDLLDQLLSKQLFRLSFWKVATEELNYRRFFTVNHLISVNIQIDDVFYNTHDLIFRNIRNGIWDGLRIDHIDGLFDPTRYVNMLSNNVPDSYITCEKILASDERLPGEWPVDGNTGYDFLNSVNGIFCMRRNSELMSDIYNDFIGFRMDFERLVRNKKKLILAKHMAGDIDNLALLMKRLSDKDRYGRDVTLYGLKSALSELITFFPVYRTYINHEIIPDIARDHIRKAIEQALRDAPSLYHELKFIEKFMLFDFPDNISDKEKKQLVRFVMKFQQFTGPLIAKGFEDTVLYIYNRLISLNEVGSEPEKFGTQLWEFHENMQEKTNSHPLSMNATSTHDTKRGEDVRTRISVLSEIPRLWEKTVRKWADLNRYLKHRNDRISMPDSNDEYFIYQTLIGTIPMDLTIDDTYVKRMTSYMVKAIREAKVHTTWISNDEEYEKACTDFITRILDGERNNAFLDSFRTFMKNILFPGVINSLGQLMIKCTAPGIPDFYQGTELWDLNLVDPDNRRPVDFEVRRSMLDMQRPLRFEDWIALFEEIDSGRIKFELTHLLLALRKEYRSVFRAGSYSGINVNGKKRRNVIAFRREFNGKEIMVIIARFSHTLMKTPDRYSPDWGDTRIDAGNPISAKEFFSGRDVSGRTVLLSEILSDLPFAMLISK
ncbi:MAG: malto-oligosyltrehalose synthase [Candidatus Muiribacteriaceae bacterium]